MVATAAWNGFDILVLCYTTLSLDFVLQSFSLLFDIFLNIDLSHYQKVRLDNALYTDLVSQLCYAAASATTSSITHLEEEIDTSNQLTTSHRTRRRTRCLRTNNSHESDLAATSSLGSASDTHRTSATANATNANSTVSGASESEAAVWAAELAWVLDVVRSHGAALPWSAVGQCAVVLCAHGRASAAMTVWDAKCVGAPAALNSSNDCSAASLLRPSSNSGSSHSSSSEHSSSSSSSRDRSSGSGVGNSMASALSLDEWIKAAVGQEDGRNGSNSSKRGLGGAVDDSTSRWDDAPEDCAHLVLQVGSLFFFFNSPLFLFLISFIAINCMVSLFLN